MRLMPAMAVLNSQSSSNTQRFWQDLLRKQLIGSRRRSPCAVASETHECGHVLCPRLTGLSVDRTVLFVAFFLFCSLARTQALSRHAVETQPYLICHCWNSRYSLRYRVLRAADEFVQSANMRETCSGASAPTRNSQSSQGEIFADIALAGVRNGECIKQHAEVVDDKCERKTSCFSYFTINISNYYKYNDV